LWLGNRFASSNSDFYQCPKRREEYGCIVANMFSHEYYFKDGRCLFVSNQTLNEGVRNQLAIKEGVLKGCEVVLSFKRFNGAKTGIGVGTWLYDEHLEKGLKPSYVVYHATDSGFFCSWHKREKESPDVVIGERGFHTTPSTFIVGLITTTFISLYRTYSEYSRRKEVERSE
jgi:hypothetical protein